MTIRLLFLIASLGCLLVAACMGFDWLVDDPQYWPGWLALGLGFLVTSDIVGDR